MKTGKKWRKIKLTLLSFVLMAALSLPAYAAEEEIIYQLDEVVVTASGFEQNIIDAPASITIITKEELNRRGYSDLAEAIGDVEGVDVLSGTGKTGGLDIRIRGMDSEYTLIMVDGIRQNGTTDVTPNGFGAMNTSFMPPLAAIERIEIIRGPMSTLYGSDAMGGVVNIITKKVADDWSGSVTLDHTFQENTDFGDISRFSFYTSGPLTKDKTGLALRGSILRREASLVESSSTGIDLSKRGPNPVKRDVYNLGGRFTWRQDNNNSFWLDAETAKQKYDNSAGQLGTLGSSGGYADELRYERQKVTLGSENKVSFGTWTTSLSYNQTETKGRLIPASAVPSGSPYIGIPRELKNSNWILDTKLVAPMGENHKLIVGGQYWDATMEDGLVMVSPGGGKFKQESTSFFAEDEWRLKDSLSLTYGGRYEHTDSFSGHFSPRTYLVWQAKEGWTVKGGVSTGYKTPKLSQLHDGLSGVSGQGTVLLIGNPNLKPEESTNTELGVHYQNNSGFSSSATMFHNRYTNKISGYSIDANTSSYTNVGKAKTQGLELSTVLPLWNEDWSLNMNYTYTHNEQLGGNDDGARLTNVPVHMANARLNYRLNDRTATWLKAEYRDKTARFTQKYDNLSAANKAVHDALGGYFKSYTLLNLGGSYKVSKDVTLNLGINNLTDKDFTATHVISYGSGSSTTTAGDYFTSGQTTTGYVVSGRNYWMSVNVTF
ncbi:TonB-dependent receptor domain-containing protein [Sporomusa termitida]